MLSLLPALLTGLFGIGGVLGGALLAGRLNLRVEKAKRKAEDQRRWLGDRQALYARFLTLSESMLQEVDGLAVFLQYSSNSPPKPEEDDEYIAGGLPEYLGRWEDEMQPLLQELQLIAGPEVSDLADRMSGALMELSTPLELRDYFVNYYPVWFCAKDMQSVLRNQMRSELGVTVLSNGQPFQRPQSWPWLADRPGPATYVQDPSIPNEHRYIEPSEQEPPNSDQRC